MTSITDTLIAKRPLAFTDKTQQLIADESYCLSQPRENGINDSEARRAWQLDL
jgi:hypothetical protein